jgi:uncharacterized linocin/CFP29 family protein
MAEAQNKYVEKIKNAKDDKSVLNVIDNAISEMEKSGIENYRISIFIRRLDISLLMLEHKGLPQKELLNIKLAQKILITKIVQGNIHELVKE